MSMLRTTMGKWSVMSHWCCFWSFSASFALTAELQSLKELVKSSEKRNARKRPQKINLHSDRKTLRLSPSLFVFSGLQWRFWWILHYSMERGYLNRYLPLSLSLFCLTPADSPVLVIAKKSFAWVSTKTFQRRTCRRDCSWMVSTTDG